MLDATLYDLHWHPTNGITWSTVANWLDYSGNQPQPADHYPGGKAGALDATDFNSSDGGAGNCIVDQNVTIAALTLENGYQGAIAMNNSVTVTGYSANNNPYAGNLVGGSITLGGWVDNKGPEKGGDLIYQGSNAVADWGGGGVPGTKFLFRDVGSGIGPGTLRVQDGASITVTGLGDHTMEVNLQIGPSTGSEPPSKVTLGSGFTSNVNFGSKSTIAIQPGGELHLDTWVSDTGGSLTSPLTSPEPIDNQGLIERTGNGVVEVQFPIKNSAGGSSLQINSGTLNVSKVDAATRRAVEQDLGSTTLFTGATLRVAGTGYKMFGGSFATSQAQGVMAVPILDGNLEVAGGSVSARPVGLNVTGSFKTSGTVTFQGTVISQAFEEDGGSVTFVGNSTLNVTGSLTVNAGTFQFGDATGGVTITTTAGVQIAAGAVFSGYGSITGNVTNGGELDDTTGALAITGSYTQTGNGTTSVVMSGPFSVSGSLDEQGGTFTVTNAVTVSGNMTIESGATLYGNSLITVDSSLTNAGEIDIAGGTGPGPSPGSIVVQGDYTQTATGVLDMHLYSQGNDALTVKGTATLGGTLNVLLGNGYVPSPGSVYVLIGYGSRSGTFATLNLPTLSFGHWDPRYDDPSYPNSFSLWDLM